MALAKRIKSYFRSSLGPPQRVVDEGWVWCPRNGNVKVEECMHCTRSWNTTSRTKPHGSAVKTQPKNFGTSGPEAEKTFES